MAMPAARAAAAPAARIGKFRWTICGLLFLAATINYVDRQVIGILKPTLQAQFGWTEIDYGDIVFAFQMAYAIGYLFAGRVMDLLGIKRGFALALAIWSMAAMAAAAVPRFGPAAALLLGGFGLTYSASVAGFIVVRFVLGLGESGNFPAAIKTVAEWFPQRERAFATGLFNAGTNIGAVITPMTVPFITARFGWPSAFVLTGVLGVAWLVAWLTIYEKPDVHPRLGPPERAFIRSDPVAPATHMPWLSLMGYRQTWSFGLAKFLTDPIWWMYLFWLPDFFSRNYGLSLLELGPPIIVIYVVADVGSVGGGWLSSALIRRGWSVNAARKTAMLGCALAVVPIVFATRVQSVWGAVALVSLATAAHQGWSANLFTFASDMFPRQAVGSVVGLGGFAGAVGGMLIAKVTGYVLQMTGSYTTVLMIAGGAYLVALTVVQILTPHLEPARVE
ncbi:MAG TPA: MFS transporter [Vicinamibacterales bacterium]|jgi:ACS family hexuronate transporter-like MFS transporter|nr:MFS transporter [Vicinamibacterales bacterium]